jgi:hypothetical protein
MSFRMHKVQVWSGEIPDRPGAAAATLERLARAGVDLEFVFARRFPERRDAGRIYVAPVEGPQQAEAARAAGLAPDDEAAMLCIEGDRYPGIGYELMSRLAVAGINLQGLSVSVVGDRFAAYLAFDHPDVATRAVQILATMV